MVVSRARLLPLLLATLIAVLTPVAGAATRDAGRTLYVDGDSIAYGTDLFLSRYLRGWTIRTSVDVSRHTYQGVASIEWLEQARALPYVVVVNLGTNDDPAAVHQFRSYVRRVV